ncbi:MAG: DUF3619 family protein [Azonexus sp.]
MNEARYGGRIRQALNHGLADISPAASRRLEAARHLALARQKQSASELVIAGGTGNFGQHGPIPYFKQLLAIAALLLGMWLSFYWQSMQYSSDIEEVDSALLTDDLPPEAFLDNDFFEWLKDNSPAE